MNDEDNIMDASFPAGEKRRPIRSDEQLVPTTIRRGRLQSGWPRLHLRV